MLGGRRCIGRDRTEAAGGGRTQPERSTQKRTEPVAFSSTVPVDPQLSPLASGSGFDLLTLRARCKQDTRALVYRMQAFPTPDFRILRQLLFQRIPRPFPQRATGHIRGGENGREKEF